MNPQFLYLEDPLKLEFESTVRRMTGLPGGRAGVVLEQTYFYPTGGGQEHDTGTLGEARVVDVYKDDQGREVIHVLDRPIAPGTVTGRIDRRRRLRHMQHHTAQHLLTQSFLRLYDLETLSANINGDSPSTLDLPAARLTPQDIEHVEDLANQIIYENRPVRTYFVTLDELDRLPLRKPPAVSENIRLVEIDGYDYSACGGTHCLATGMIGVVKILKLERQNERTRVVFIAGMQAVEYFREYQEIATRLAAQLSVHPRDLLAAIQRQVDELHAAQKMLQAQRGELLALEAHRLAEAGEWIGARRAVWAAFEHRPAQELRRLAEELLKVPCTVAVLANFDGQKLTLVVACARDSGVAARDLLNRLLALTGGRGGGDEALGQGGSPATAEHFRAFVLEAGAIVRETLTNPGQG